MECSITTLHTRGPLDGKHEMSRTRKGEEEVPIPDGGKPAKPLYESMVGLVGWWRRVEMESSREEENSRRMERKIVHTARDRK